MARIERFTFLCDKNERALIAMLAERLRRSQSDAVRFLVVEAAKELNVEEATDHNAKTTEAIADATT